MPRVTETKKLSIWGKLKRLALTDVGALARGFKAADLEAMERVLLESDFGIRSTGEIIDALDQEIRRGKLKSEDDLRRAIVDRVVTLLSGPPHPAELARAASGPTILI